MRARLHLRKTNSCGPQHEREMTTDRGPGKREREVETSGETTSASEKRGDNFQKGDDIWSVKVEIRVGGQG